MRERCIVKAVRWRDFVARLRPAFAAGDVASGRSAAITVPAFHALNDAE